MTILLYILVLLLLPAIINYIFIKKNKTSIDIKKIICHILISDLSLVVISKYFYRMKEIKLSVGFIILFIITSIVISLITSVVMNNKFKDSYKSITKKVDKLSERRWNLLTGALLLLLMVAVSPRIIVEPYLMVEDGKIFLNQQFQNGLLSIFDSYGGYCILLSRLSAFIAAHIGKLTNSIVVTVDVLKWITILFDILCINYLNKDDYSWLIKNRIIRFLLSIFFMYLLGNFQFLFYSTTSSHWFCGFLCFIVGINIINNKYPKLLSFPIIIISVLSSPSGLLLGLSLLINLICKINKKSIIVGTIKNYNKRDLFKIMILVLVLIIQLIFMLFIMKGDNTQANGIISSMYHVFVLVLNVPSYLLGTEIAIKIDNISISSIIGAVFIVFAFINASHKKVFIYSILSILFLYFMVLYKNSDPEYYMYLYNNKYWFYNALPGAIFAFEFYIDLLLNIYNKDYRTFFICYIVLIGFIIQHLYYYNYDYGEELKKIDSQVDFNCDHFERIPIFPGGKWYIDVPVREDGA